MDWLRKIWKGEFLQIPSKLWVLRITMAVLVVGLLITMLLIWVGLDVEKNKADQVTLTIGVLGALFLGTVGLLNLFANYRRTNTLEEELKARIKSDKNREEQFEKDLEQRLKSDERRDNQRLYTTNVQNLGHESESVKLGGIYGLERLAKDSRYSDDPWGPKVAEILCTHVRTTTGKSGYVGENKERPSNEITAMLKTLTQGKNNPFEHIQFDLDRAILKNAPLSEANLQMASLRRANLSEVDFIEADLSRADMRGADMRGADLRLAKLDRADLRGTKLERGDLRRANLDTSNLSRANLSRANFGEANLIGADLSETDMREADMRGVNLIRTNLTGARLSKANLSRTIMLSGDKNKRAHLSGCRDYSATDLRDIYWGLYTRSLAKMMQKDLDTGSRENQKQYLAQNSVRRKPTQEEKEYLVGKGNVNKCIWGDIFVLEDKG